MKTNFFLIPPGRQAELDSLEHFVAGGAAGVIGESSPHRLLLPLFAEEARPRLRALVKR